MLHLLPVAGIDWTDAEHVELQRLREEPEWTLEFGRADEGDPWCLVHDGAIIVAHIARIGRKYVVDCPALEYTNRTHMLGKAVDFVLESRESFVALRRVS